MIIFLIGPRCSGKTTMGKALAQHMNLSFADTDAEIVAKAGCSIPEIVEREGWEGFRKRETEALLAVTKEDTIIATGGGIVLAEANREHMKNAGTVIYLKAPANVLCDRMQKDQEGEGRPSLTGKNPVEEMEEVLKEREPLYAKAAERVVDASPAPDKVLGALVAGQLQFSIFSLLQNQMQNGR